LKWDKDALSKLDKRYKVNLCNSLPGVKAANVIGTVSSQGQENLAIFSSVIHLGSEPFLLGFITRPAKGFLRHTYRNIQDSKYYTINTIPYDMTEKAHYTSAKVPKEDSEFDVCHIEKIYMNDFPAPFVKQSPVSVGMKLLHEIPIEFNNTTFVIGSVEMLYIQDTDAIQENGTIELDRCNIAGIGSLNSYYRLTEKKQFPYATVDNIPKFTK
jgi:flavin reductase (DIM6/NTAB) family NADH-FMN oxidoreductase RutF